jgi:chromosome segregation ATPase
MWPFEWLRKAAPIGLPILASIAAVVLLGESYSISSKFINYERLRADHESLITTVGEKRREADQATANLARITGDLNGANAGIRKIVEERELALKEIAEARAGRASTEVQRHQIEERMTALQADAETKKVELSQVQKSITAAGDQLANIKLAITAEQARLIEAQNQARSATETSARLLRQAAEGETRRTAMETSFTEASNRLTVVQREVEAAAVELEQRRKEAQTVTGEATTLRAQIGRIRGESETADREFAQLQQRRTTLQSEVTRLQSQITDLAAQATQRNTDVTGLVQRDRDLREQLTTAEVALKSARVEEIERRSSIKAFNAELSRLKQEASGLESRQAALAAATSQLTALQEQITLRQREITAAIVEANKLTEQITRRREEAALIDKTTITMVGRRNTLGSELSELEKRRATLQIEIFDLERRRLQSIPFNWPSAR